MSSAPPLEIRHTWTAGHFRSAYVASLPLSAIGGTPTPNLLIRSNVLRRATSAGMPSYAAN